MNPETFWNLIDNSRQEADGDIEIQARLLTAALARLPKEEIVSFEENLVCWLWQTHDARLMAASAILDDMDDDDFQDFGLWLISRGKSVFDRCMQDPEALAEVVQPGDRIKAQEIGSVGREAYKQRTGRDDFHRWVGAPLPPKLKNADFSWQTPEGYPDTVRLETLFPRLWSKFGRRFAPENR